MFIISPLDSYTSLQRGPFYELLLKSATRAVILKHEPDGASFCPKPCYGSHQSCPLLWLPPHLLLFPPAHLAITTLVCTLFLKHTRPVPASAPLNWTLCWNTPVSKAHTASSLTYLESASFSPFWGHPPWPPDSPHTPHPRLDSLCLFLTVTLMTCLFSNPPPLTPC